MGHRFYHSSPRKSTGTQARASGWNDLYKLTRQLFSWPFCWRWGIHTPRTGSLSASLFWFYGVGERSAIVYVLDSHRLTCPIRSNKPLTDSGDLKADDTTHTDAVHVTVLSIWGWSLDIGPGTNTIVESIGWMQGFTPNGFMDIQISPLYQARFCFVSPKRRKNTTANIGLIHWSNLIVKIVQAPDECHSCEVTVGMAERSAWATFHPGQKPSALVCSRPWTRLMIARGSVMTASKRPSARSFRKLCRFTTLPLLSNTSSRSFLCLK